MSFVLNRGELSSVFIIHSLTHSVYVVDDHIIFTNCESVEIIVSGIIILYIYDIIWNVLIVMPGGL